MDVARPATARLGSVVMIANVSNSEPSIIARLHRPAKQNHARSVSAKAKGVAIPSGRTT